MIQWYPGHMAKAIREISEKLTLVDLVIVLLDARIPESSMNPVLKELLQNKRVLYILTKRDKADEKITLQWLYHYHQKGISALAIDARNRKHIGQVIKAAELLMAEKRAKDTQKGIKPRPIRTMVVGIPNVGKSTFINAITGKKVAMVGDRPGITKSQQWVRINQNMELLDTPGVLWPKFEDQMIGMHLAITGAIKDDILPLHEIGNYFVNFLKDHYPQSMKERYNIDINLIASEILEIIGKKQNYYYADKEVDLDRTTRFLLQEYRDETLGKITLDWCNNE